ncbi:hypothetical protein ACQCN2_03365 [Brevibacillus ginsengisoli]|uniref:hypothetical protein n=1 Tax=Brevibacillus ginsengisoli TaxID=363854 RepID=UPI003CF4F873
MREYLLYCTNCLSYTLLHGYEKETGNFLGEYSLLLNEYTRNNWVVNKFLLSHLEHSIRVIPSQTEEYKNIICTDSHFLEDDIDKYVEESLAWQKFEERNKQSERLLGRIQLHLAEHLVRSELEKITKTSSSSPAEGQVLLGQELGMKKALEIIRNIILDKQFPQG